VNELSEHLGFVESKNKRVVVKSPDQERGQVKGEVEGRRVARVLSASRHVQGRDELTAQTDSLREIRESELHSGISGDHHQFDRHITHVGTGPSELWKSSDR